MTTDNRGQQLQEGSSEEDKQTQGDSVEEPVDKEEEKMDTGNGGIDNDEEDKEIDKEGETEAREEGEVESPEDKNRTEEEGANDQDKQPGPGGLLFGTLFNYMEDKTEGEAGVEDTAETAGKPTPVQDAETVEEATTT